MNDEIREIAIETPIRFNNKIYRPSNCICNPRFIEIAGHKKNCKEGRTRNRMFNESVST